MDEIWKDIPGYEGKYQASSLGRIRSLDRYVRCGKGGSAQRLMKGKVLRPAGQKTDPHLRVVLGHGANGSCVHTLVAAAFLGPRPEGADVRHLDGDPTNNTIENLAYGSRTDNILDVYRAGGTWRKLSVEDALDIKRRLSAGEVGRRIAELYGVGEACISSIKKGRSFSWLQNA